MKPFSAKELVAKARATVKLSQLRKELAEREKQEALHQQLVYSVTDKIRSGLFTVKDLDLVVEQIRDILGADCVFACRLLDDPQEIETENQDKAQEPPRPTCTVVAECINTTVRSQNPRASLVGKSLPLRCQRFLEAQESDRDDLLVDLTQTELALLPKGTGAPIECISSPVHVRDKIWGLLRCLRKSRHARGRPWGEMEYSLLGSVAGQVGLGIVQVQMAEAQREEHLKLEAANAANKAKNQIMANISHELRTPLNAIIGLAEIMRETNLTLEQEEMLHTVQNSG